jgi:hypothetical protein
MSTWSRNRAARDVGATVLILLGFAAAIALHMWWFGGPA